MCELAKLGCALVMKRVQDHFVLVLSLLLGEEDVRNIMSGEGRVLGRKD